MNSKKSNQIEPAAETSVVEQFHRLREVLAGTHAEIPTLLAHERRISSELGLGESEELHQQLDDVVQQRQAAVRRRSAAIAAILALEPTLQAERGAVEAQRQEYAVQAVQAFQRRYEAAVSELQRLWQEGRVLGEALRCEVKMPLPVRVAVSPVDAVPRAVPILAAVQVQVDAEAARLGGMIDQLDTALGLVASVQQSKELDAKHRALSQLRSGAPTRMEGTFEVAKAFSYYGMEFEVGMLLDRSLLPDGCLSRFLVGRHIRALDGAAVAA